MAHVAYVLQTLVYITNKRKKKKKKKKNKGQKRTDALRRDNIEYSNVTIKQIRRKVKILLRINDIHIIKTIRVFLLVESTYVDAKIVENKASDFSFKKLLYTYITSLDPSVKNCIKFFPTKSSYRAEACEI